MPTAIVAMREVKRILPSMTGAPRHGNRHRHGAGERIAGMVAANIVRMASTTMSVAKMKTCEEKVAGVACTVSSSSNEREAG